MPSPNRRINTLHTGCETSGTFATELYDPVVAFAREHLVEQEPGEIHASLFSGATQSLSDGVSIVVEPRSIVGQLRIALVGPPFYAPGQRWAETRYCLHVVQQSHGTTIVVKQSWSMIK